MKCSTSTAHHSDEEMGEDADEEGSGSDETWVAPNAVESTAPGVAYVSFDSDPLPSSASSFISSSE